VNAVRKDTSSTQFLRWMRYLQWDFERVHREDYYFAQLAAEVHTGLKDTKGKQIQLTDFILKFGGEKTPKRDLSKEEITASHKSFWKAALGFGKKKRNKKKKGKK